MNTLFDDVIRWRGDGNNETAPTSASPETQPGRYRGDPTSGRQGRSDVVGSGATDVEVRGPEDAGGVASVSPASQLRALTRLWFRELAMPERVRLLNELRSVLAEQSPFESEPVDHIEWVSADEVVANDYNPNQVAPPEMELLRLSIMADGFTQPIVTNQEDGARVVIDGFHRNRVGKECEDVRDRVQGYLPVVQIRADRGDTPDRMASTIRHNRARGKHQVIKMSEIVLELKRRNWSDKKIGTELGMDPDEVLRLTQIMGLAKAFEDHEFSEAWEAETGGVDDLDDEALAEAGVDGGLLESERAGA